MKRCPKCGITAPRDLAFCPACHAEFGFRATERPLAPTALPSGARWVAPAPHDVSIAALAAIFIVGAGQCYNGQTAKGLTLMGVGLALFALAICLWSDVLIGMDALLWFVAIFDATAIASRRLDGEDLRPWQWF